jgi:hypothetical protein
MCPIIGSFHGPGGRFGGDPFLLRIFPIFSATSMNKKKEARIIKLKIWGSMEIKPT